MNDADFMLAVLEEDPGEWVPQYVILNRSFSERGCGLTVHSRAASLRDLGHVVECKVERIKGGRAASFYRLVPRSEPPVSTVGVASLAGGSDGAGGALSELAGSMDSRAGDTARFGPVASDASARTAGSESVQLSLDEAAA